MEDNDSTFTAITDEMVKYVKAKYGDTWLEEDEMSDEMFEDLCRFAKEAEVMKGYSGFLYLCDWHFKG